MIVTKKEAKKLWCPIFYRGSISGTTKMVCLADGCMMWVWSAEEYVNEQGNVPKGSCGLVQKYH